MKKIDRVGFSAFFKANWHYLLILYVPLYLAAFFWLESRPMEEYWVTHVPMDDVIPFVAPFAVPYCMWYPLLFCVGLFLLIKDVPVFKKFMFSLMAGLSLSLLICLLVPNGQELRPASFEKENVFTWIMERIYSADTNTNVLPSMHVAGTLAAVYGTALTGAMKRHWVKAVLYVVSSLIILSTVLVKQHAVLDLVAGLALGVICCTGVEHACRLHELRAAATAAPENDCVHPASTTLHK